jgi:hypothetical protein
MFYVVNSRGTYFLGPDNILGDRDRARTGLHDRHLLRGLARLPVADARALGLGQPWARLPFRLSVDLHRQVLNHSYDRMYQARPRPGSERIVDVLRQHPAWLGLDRNVAVYCFSSTLSQPH